MTQDDMLLATLHKQQEADELELGLWVESLPPEHQDIVLNSLRRLDAQHGDHYAKRFVRTRDGRVHFLRVIG